MRPIDADALKYAFKIEQNLGCGDFEAAIEIVDCAPTIGAVKVVRCRDCMYYKNEKLLRVEGSDFFTCPANGGLFGPDDYCSSGERSEI